MSQNTHSSEKSTNMTFKSMHTCSINLHITTLPTLASVVTHWLRARVSVTITVS